MSRILVTGTSVDERYLNKLQEAGYDIVREPGLLVGSQLQAALKGIDGYLLGGDEFVAEEALKEANLLKVISFLGVGFESFVDAKAARAHGVAVTNTPGVLANSVAEFTIAHLLNARRRFVPYAEAFRSGHSGHEEKMSDISDHNVGIVGLGASGTRIAEILRQGFGARISYYSRTRKPQVEERLGISYAGSLNDLFSWAESIILMLPGNDQTQGMVDDALLGRGPANQVLINTARAQIVDPDALTHALRTGALAFAGFDGFYDDPMGSDILSEFGSEKLVVTGHIASLTNDARDSMAEMCIESLQNILAGRADDHVVN